MTTLSTRVSINELGDDLEISVEYEYLARHRELFIQSATTDDHQQEVWHLLSQNQRWRIEEECVEDYGDRTAGAVCSNREFRLAV